jgi:DNA primase
VSLFNDLKYLRLISNRLPLFKQKSDRLYNCRCVLCGDSESKKNKARGFFYPSKNDLVYKCHNCGASMHFGSFLKQFDGMQYNQYVMERYSEGLPMNKPHQKIEDKFKMAEPVFEKSEETLLDKLLDRLDTLPEDHEAVQFCLKRQIPRDKFKRLYFIENMKDIGQLSPKYKDKITTKEPRLVIPFYNHLGQLSGVTCRALRGEELRYVLVKIKEDDSLVFGMNEVDRTKPIHVVEGPLDSLFLPNAIAVGGTSFGKMETIGLPKDKLIMIIDNQPRNKDVCRVLDKIIERQYNVVVWPQTIEEKDINEMILSGIDVQKIIKKNTFVGLEAKLKFVEWKRC